MDAKFDFSNVFSPIIECGITGVEIEKTVERLTTCYRDLVERHERGELGFMNLVDQDVTGIVEVARYLRDRYDQLLLIGIGGSSLGVEALVNAVGYNKNSSLFVLDNVDPLKFKRVLDSIRLEKTLITVVSKSGTTLEAVANFFIIYDIFSKVLGKEPVDQIVIITDPEKGPLRKFAREKGIVSFPVPPNVGGRFSVLSPVGLFPIAFLGYDVESLILGAKGAIPDDGSLFSEHPAFLLSSVYYLYYQKGYNINVIMTYVEAMEKFVDWLRQLLAESLGKDGKGQTPVKAIGTVDQHSQIQLYNEGPRDKIITFIVSESFVQDFTIHSPLFEEFSYLKGKSLKDIVIASYEGTRDALTENGVPNISIRLAGINEAVIGYLFMVFEIAVALSGYLYEVNPYDQPGVERGKEIARNRLRAL